MSNRKPHHAWAWAVLLILCGGGGGGEAFAQNCDIDIGGIQFGTYDPLPGLALDRTGFFRGRCKNPTAQARKAVICIGFRAGSEGISVAQRRLRTPAGDVLNYQLYKDAARQQRWGTIAAGEHLKIEMTLPGNTNVDIPNTIIYGRIPGGQQTAVPGQYSTSYPYPGQVDADIAFVAPNASHICQSPGNIGNSQVVIVTSQFIRARINKKCAISTVSDLDFGEVNGLNVPTRTGAFKVDIRCTKNTGYSIALDDGSHSDTPGQRRMSDGSGHYINYEIFQAPGYSTRWGSTAGGATGVLLTPLSGTGSLQGHQGNGRVLAQTAAAPGEYQDKVLVTVTY